MPDQSEINDQLAARLSVIEFFIEVFAANQMLGMVNAEQFLGDLRARLTKPRPHQGGPIDLERLQRTHEDMRVFGEHLANKIEQRWREISGQ